MRLESLPSPGAVTAGPALRSAALNAVNEIQRVIQLSGQSTAATSLAAFFTGMATLVTGLVPVPPETVTVTNTGGALAVNTRRQLTVAVGPAGASQRVAWTSADPTKVVVDQEGRVARIAAGTVVVTATSTADPAVKGTASVT